MPFLIGIGIFFAVGAIVATLATKKVFLGDIGNISEWLMKKIGNIIIFIIGAGIIIFIIGGLITFFS